MKSFKDNCLIWFGVFILILLGLFDRVNAIEDESKVTESADLFTDEMAFFADDNNRFKNTLDIETIKNIGKISQGILNIVKKRNQGLWYYCGKRLNEIQKEEMATSISYNIITSQQSIGLENVSSWGIAATIYNESGFDACALGIHPRKWGYKNKLLNKKKSNITHTKIEVLNFIRNPKSQKKYMKSGFDLGYCQVLSRFYRGQEEDMLSNAVGIRICVIEMQRRAQYNKTKMPWLYWKGTNKTYWYRNKIRRWARIMNAPKKEMIRI